MPGSRNKNHRRSSSSDSSDWSSSQSDNCTTECKRHEKRRERSCSPDRKPKRERSCSPDRKPKRERSCSPKRERSCSPKREKECSSEIEHYSNEKECKPHSECEKKYSFTDVYNYFKYRLLEDEELMVGGSRAYMNSVSNIAQIVPTNLTVDFNQIVINHHVETVYMGSPFFVRESGVYILFFSSQTENASQFTVFVNGVSVPTTCVGTNSGAGQVVSRHMIRLEKNDNVVIRNYISTANSVTLNLYSGGTQPGNDATILLMKIAPHHAPVFNHELVECLSKHKRRLFSKLLDRLLLDSELMMKGFNVRGAFHNNSLQTVLTESDIVFNNMSNVNLLSWVPSAPTQVKILEDGVYKLFFLANTTTAAQFSLTVNGVPVDSSTQGTNRGAGQVSVRAIVALKKNDIVTVRNHTSANGQIVISQNAGGAEMAVNVILTIFKLAPYLHLMPVPVPCKVAEHYKCYYEKFKQYLLSKCRLQIAGSPAYLSVTCDVTQKINLNDLLHFSTELISRNIDFIPGGNNFVIKQDGVYDVFADISVNEPCQITVFVNGVADSSTTFGRDSGGARTLLRQFMALKKGDVISLRNYSSHINTFHISENAGGNFIGQNAMFMLFMLSNLPLMPL